MRRTPIPGLLLLFVLFASSQLSGTNLDSLTNLLGKYQEGKERVDVLNQLADFYTMNSPELVRKYGDEALKLSKELGYPEGISRAANSISWSYRINSNYDLGMLYAQMALNYAIQTEKPILEADAHYSLGIILRERQDYEAGRKHFRISRKLYAAAEDFQGQGNSVNAIGESFRLSDNLDSALFHYEEASRLFSQCGNVRGKLIMQNNFGLILLRMENWQAALDSLTLSYEGSGGVSFAGLQLESRDGMAQAHLGLKDYAACRREATETLESARAQGFTKYEGFAHKTLMKLAKALGNLDDALFHQEAYLDIQKRLFEKSIVNQIDNLEMEIELREKNARIEGLEKDQEIRSLSQWLLVLGSVFLLFIFVLVLIDARKRARTNQLLQTQNEELEQLNMEKDSLVNIVAHDLKSPLNKVGGLIEAMSMSGELNGQQEKLAGMIRRVVGDGERLVRDLLDISYAEQVSPQEKSEFDLAELLKEIVDVHQKSAARKQIQIQFESQSDKLPVKSERDSIARIFDNLLSNAIKYSPMDSNIWIKTGKDEEQVYMEVRDEGPGISAEDQAKMFKKFQKLSARPTAGESSNGLGLAIVKILTNRLKGRIQVESDLGKGARFRVVFPN